MDQGMNFRCFAN